MKRTITLLLLVLFGAVSGHTEVETMLDSNTAFYEGKTLNYIIHPPNHFKMVDWDATADGFTFAFIPKNQSYDEADFMIGANIFKLTDLSIDEVIARDTIALRKHYGDNVSIWPVDSIFTASGYEVPTFFINDPEIFLPNVMISYVNGETELLIFELIITDRAVRMKAEDAFIECLSKLKVLPSAELGYN